MANMLSRRCSSRAAIYELAWLTAEILPKLVAPPQRYRHRLYRRDTVCTSNCEHLGARRNCSAQHNARWSPGTGAIAYRALSSAARRHAARSGTTSTLHRDYIILASM